MTTKLEYITKYILTSVSFWRYLILYPLSIVLSTLTMAIGLEARLENPTHIIPYVTIVLGGMDVYATALKTVVHIKTQTIKFIILRNTFTLITEALSSVFLIYLYERPG